VEKRAPIKWVVGWAPAALAGVLLAGVPVLRQLMGQVLWGYALMAAALPLCRVLEKRLSPGLSALGALTGLILAVLLAVLLLAPAVLRQLGEVAGMTPHIWQRVSPLMALLPLEEAAGWLGQMVKEIWLRLRALAGSLGRLMLSPALAFYFLRDRETITRGLCLMAPLGCRARAVRAAREAKRELTGFLRGQGLTCLCVGGLTALGLLLCGVPCWLLLGALMGVMELVPYVGPLAAAVPILLFALPRGMTTTLWALGVVLAVQQAEGSFLSPRLMAASTRLHPAWVLLIVSLGSLTAGVGGMLLSLPLAVAARGAARGFMKG